MNASILTAPDLRGFLGIFKPRIGLAIGLAALAGMAITPGPGAGPWQACALMIAVMLSSSAAAAFNQLAERDLDARMLRTNQRAFVTGRLRAGPGWLVLFAAVGAAGVGLAAYALNAMAAVYTFLGAFTYAVIYTIWLKRRTPWNIVIGGLAGSFAVLAGGAVAAPQSLPAVTLSFAWVLFLWTPPHFWSLAIALHEDYAAAGVPMLPVVVGDARAARAVFASAALLVAASIVPALTGLGTVYLVAAIGAGILLLVRSAQLVRAPGPAAAMTNFHASLVYLAVLIGAAIADSLLRA